MRDSAHAPRKLIFSICLVLSALVAASLVRSACAATPTMNAVSQTSFVTVPTARSC
jgi:hypothetical protein